MESLNKFEKLLLKKKSKNLKISSDCYESFDSGYIDFKEDYLKAAIRKLKEEFGIKTRLYPAMKIRFKHKRIAMLFFGFIDNKKEIRISFNEEEVEDLRFNSIKEVLKKEKFTPSFKETFQKILTIKNLKTLQLKIA
ncbi:MAG: NUDIX domain-containing protein [Candidatus Woesearchaeota archaeon]